MGHPTFDVSAEQERFMAVAYDRAERTARRAFKGWHSRKRDDAIAEMIAKCWATWDYNVEKGKDPVALLGPNIHFAIMWVRYDRKIAGRARSYDIEDYRANMTRDDRPVEWVERSLGDDPSHIAEALEALGLTLEDLRE